MVLWTWHSPSPSLALGLSGVEQQPGLRSLTRYGRQRVEVCKRREKSKRGCVVLAAKRDWEEIWEPREVTLDASDLAMLELRSLLGEPRDLSVAKIVAKKLNPSATNLDVEKIVKQKGAKTFLKLLKTEQSSPPTRKPEVKPGVPKKQDAGLPLPLAPKPSGLQTPSRQPGYMQPVEWPEEADIELRRTSDRVFDARRKPLDDMIQLSPKPRGASQSSTSSLTSRYVEPATPTVRKEVKQPVPKLVPELSSRPSRGGAAEVFPGLAKPAPPKKDLPVPSLSVKPAVPVPAPSTVPEETPSPTLEMQAPPATRVEPGLAQRPVQRKLTKSEDTKEEAPQSSILKESPGAAALRKEPDLLNKPVSSPKNVVNERTRTEESAAPSIREEPDLLNKPVINQTVTESALSDRTDREESSTASTRKEPDLLNKPVSRPKDVVNERTGTEESSAPSIRKEPDLLNKAVNNQTVTESAVSGRADREESSAASTRKEPDLLNKPVNIPKVTENVVNEGAGTEEASAPLRKEESSAASSRKEPDLLNKPVSLHSQKVTEVAESNGSANVRHESDLTKEATSVSRSSNRAEEVLPVLEKPPAIVQEALHVADKLQTDTPAKNGFGELGSDEAVSSQGHVSAQDPEAQEITLVNRPSRSVPDIQTDAAGDTLKTVTPQKAYTQEEIERDWALAEVARDTNTVQDVVFVGSNVGGMIVRFGCLNGFLPGKDLLESRSLKTFRSWARDNGHYVNHTSVWDSSEGLESTYVASKQDDQGLQKDTENHSLHPACEADINMLYREHRTSLLSSLVGERSKVMIVAVDKAKKKIIFSERKAIADNSAIVERRAALMSRLKTGEVVKGRVRNISLFGVFVELAENVSGLIRFSELSWSPVPDPAKVVTVGEVIETVVHKLDHDRQRIYLSLKRMSPDPLLETVESMLAREEVGDSDISAPTPVPEFDELVRRLESREEIQEVVQGRRLHSRAVVPGFQVYLSSTLPEGYELLARLGNEVQEVLVQTTIERDSLISMIRELSSSGAESS